MEYGNPAASQGMKVEGVLSRVEKDDQVMGDEERLPQATEDGEIIRPERRIYVELETS